MLPDTNLCSVHREQTEDMQIIKFVPDIMFEYFTFFIAHSLSHGLDFANINVI